MTEVLVEEPSAIEVEMAIEKLKMYKASDGGEPDALDLLVRRRRATCSGPTHIRDVQDMSRVVTGKIDHGALGYNIKLMVNALINTIIIQYLGFPIREVNIHLKIY
ncbi:hypothetical protein C0J52_12807 [Blattella germanica]|nr:hypothetical protein C0J52_12807 [Blattella germanica]